MKFHYFKCSTVLILFIYLPFLLASEGDRSPFYQKCVKNCVKSDCTEDAMQFTPEAAKKLETTNPLLMWNCQNECRYNCMWRTVEGFEQRGFDIPKFHGKWPFKRILGLQEPAAVFASLLNLAAHVFMHVEVLRLVPRDHNTSIVYFWHFFSAVCMNSWIWSMIFHARDTPFTEFMDYACALSMVVVMYMAAALRVFRRLMNVSAALVAAGMYLKHVVYLYQGRVDYSYNMVVNVFFGAAGSVLWLYWGVVQYASGRRYAGWLIAFVLLSAATLSLELLDFPPYKYTWDAHALWHLATVPLPLLFFRFVIEDLLYEKRRQGAKTNLKLA